MKKLIKRYLVLIVVAVLFVGAVTLNFFANSDKKESDTEAPAVQTAAVAAEPKADYFEAFREDREEVRRLEMQYLDEVMATVGEDRETMSDAQEQKLALVDNMEKEFTVESLIKAKGFEDAAVTFHGGNVNIVVSAEELGEDQVAQILEIAMRETGEPAKSIKVMAQSNRD